MADVSDDLKKNLQVWLLLVFFFVTTLALPIGAFWLKPGGQGLFGKIPQMFPGEPYPSVPASQPPASQPPASQPPASQPPASQPPASQPPASQPPASPSHGPINTCSSISPKTPSVQKGQTLTFACTGTVEDQDHVADFRVRYRAYGSNSFSQVAAQTKIANSGSTQTAVFRYNYTVPGSAADGDYLVECRICNPDETQCTVWGKAQ